MANPVAPAPLWRRLGAAVYDALLLLGLWLVTLTLDVIFRDLAGLARSEVLLRILLFLIGLGFFGWFWTHGGQTLGMRSWRLRVRREDGAALRWPVAATRYVVMLLSWVTLLTPLLLQLPHLRELPNAQPVAAAAAALSIAALVLMQLDARRRAPCDRISGTEVVALPKAG